MELLSHPLQKPGLGQSVRFVRLREVHMQRRNSAPVRELDHSGKEMLAGFRWRVWTQEQAWSRHRGKGHGRQQLGVVSPAGTFIGIRPAVVENVFAIGMRLCVERYDAYDLVTRSGE